MNSTIVGICLNGITVSTEEYTIGHFSPNGIQQRHRTVPCLCLSLKGVSSTSYHTITNAENIYEATSKSNTEYQTGGSIGFPAGPIPAGAGVDYLEAKNNQGKTVYTGISSGPGVSTPGMEIHRTSSSALIDTKEYSFNLFDWIESWFDKEEG